MGVDVEVIKPGDGKLHEIVQKTMVEPNQTHV